MKRLFFFTATCFFIFTGCDDTNTNNTVVNTPIAVVPNTTVEVVPTTIVDLTNVNTTMTADTALTNTLTTNTLLTNTALTNTAITTTGTDVNTNSALNTSITPSNVNMDKYVISSTKLDAIKAGMTQEELIKEVGIEPYNPANTAIGKDKTTVSYYDGDYNPVTITFVDGVVESISK